MTISPLSLVHRLQSGSWFKLARAGLAAATPAGAAVLFVIVAAATVPMFMGNRTFAVMSGSMEPAITTGAAVVAVPIPSKDLQIGNVVVFLPNPEASMPIVHRIVNIEMRDGLRYFTTRGDANGTTDAEEFALPATAWRVWYSVPFAGYVIYFATSGLGTWLLVIIPSVGLATMWIVDKFKGRLRTLSGSQYIIRRP